MSDQTETHITAPATEPAAEAPSAAGAKLASQPHAGPHVIVYANEKGGTGKSTTAVHTAVALATRGARVACIDLDHRQRTLGRYLDNRAATVERTGQPLPIPDHATGDGQADGNFEDLFARFSDGYDFLVIDTPGRDDPCARTAAALANTLVTPMNDSFVDFDLIGQVDAETFKVKRPSFYSELIWDVRKARAKADGTTIDWVVLRNRLAYVDARNMRRVSEALDQLSRRVGFRIIPGLGERVIYRELFPAGLTLLDNKSFGGMGLSHVAARQELREMMAGFALPDVAQGTPASSAAA
ncbi:chromosome partitioning protein [Sphingomonas palmae]|uniref:Chromosome partitioning protein n=1 Tax=Sphingomonas palmae TaxID=1855283 RepID=A0A1H7UI16_9SPHN|nr:chromosome partitioning protein [Sphingomonas palmae]